MTLPLQLTRACVALRREGLGLFFRCNGITIHTKHIRRPIHAPRLLKMMKKWMRVCGYAQVREVRGVVLDLGVMKLGTDLLEPVDWYVLGLVRRWLHPKATIHVALRVELPCHFHGVTPYRVRFELGDQSMAEGQIRLIEDGVYCQIFALSLEQGARTALGLDDLFKVLVGESLLDWERFQEALVLWKLDEAGGRSEKPGFSGRRTLVESAQSFMTDSDARNRTYLYIVVLG
ncbi:Hypothetical predicted protein [Lecanosticta acicola]|uniref:Uncharacterized protein n=1 Tax=Lecanosticta acicola TaxID=111012 RepID=A0AAI9EC01_9PEZI|nr:Hypothetical predicted protein [Lecanosticta acicola]